MSKIIIAMSGGVDSSVAAYLCLKAGYSCIGATMKLFDNEHAALKMEKTCCSLEDAEDARSVAFKLGIPHYVFNFSDEFIEKVMDKFVAAYESGATPNPCIDCNRYLKFEKLFQRMEELGADFVATGHYARIEKNGGRYLLKKAVDETKDQSYVLYAMTQYQLAHALFPLGDIRKTRTRAIAEELGFVNAGKRDSQDICFVPDGDYAKFIGLYTGKSYPPGDFVDRSGNILGGHQGIIRYTIGQRRGLGLSSSKPLYVCDKDAAENKVVLGRDGDLYTRALDAEDFNWIAFDAPPETLRVGARVRYKQKEQPAEVTLTGADSVHVEFEEPQRAIAKGQAVVLYDGDTVLGGGTIR